MFYTSALEFPAVVITIMPKCSLSNLDVLYGGLNAVQLNHLFSVERQCSGAPLSTFLPCYVLLMLLIVEKLSWRI